MEFQLPTPSELQSAAEEYVRPLLGRGGSLNSEKARAMVSDFLAGSAAVINYVNTQTFEHVQ